MDEGMRATEGRRLARDHLVWGAEWAESPAFPKHPELKPTDGWRCLGKVAKSLGVPGK